MNERRHHSDILIAGLVFIGVLTLLGIIAVSWIDGSRVVQAAFWFCGPCAAGYLARRAARDLSLGELAIALIVMTALVAGLFSTRGYRAEPQMALWIAVGLLGAMLGGRLARQREPSGLVLSLAAGFTGLGAAVLDAGIASCLGLSDSIGVPLSLAGMALGVLAAARYTTARWEHCALGMGAICGVLLAMSKTDLSLVASILAGLAFGALMGCIGGGIGAVLRRRAARARRDLPQVRVRVGH
jgi:hypothetical protein